MIPMPTASCLATTSHEGGVQWLLRRNCSVTPGQMFTLFLSLCGVSLTVAGFFWFSGATLVLPFAAVELVVVGGAFLVHARHATDQERISLCQGRLIIEQECGGRLRRCEFPSHAVRVATSADRDRWVEVQGSGQAVRLGRFLRADLRPVLVQEIRAALSG